MWSHFWHLPMSDRPIKKFLTKLGIFWTFLCSGRAWWDHHDQTLIKPNVKHENHLAAASVSTWSFMIFCTSLNQHSPFTRQTMLIYNVYIDTISFKRRCRFQKYVVDPNFCTEGGREIPIKSCFFFWQRPLGLLVSLYSPFPIFIKPLLIGV